MYSSGSSNLCPPTPIHPLPPPPPVSVYITSLVNTILNELEMCLHTHRDRNPHVAMCLFLKHILLFLYTHSWSHVEYMILYGCMSVDKQSTEYATTIIQLLSIDDITPYNTVDVYRAWTPWPRIQCFTFNREKKVNSKSKMHTKYYVTVIIHVYITHTFT